MTESEKPGTDVQHTSNPSQSANPAARGARRARNTRILVESVVTAVLGVFAGKLAGAITGSAIGSGAIGGAVGGIAGLLFLRREKRLSESGKAQEGENRPTEPRVIES